MAIVCNQEIQQMPELVFVDVASGPDEIYGNCVPVIHRVEEVEHCLCGDDVAFPQE